MTPAPVAAATGSGSPVSPSRPPPWRDVRVLAWAFQLAVAAAVGALILWLVSNVRANSSSQGIPTGFDYLDQPAQLTIPGNGMRATQPVRDAIVQGTLNTLRVSIVGILAATVIGVLIGIGRLSGNWIVRNAARVYVEAIRNVPLLAIVTFSYLAFVLVALPRLDDALEPLGLVVVSNRGAVVPWYKGSGWLLLGSVAAGLVVGLVTAKFVGAAVDRGASRAHPWRWGLLAGVVVGVVAVVVSDVGLSRPDRVARNVSGGITMGPEYLALLVALVVYTASHIAEIVRGSIQAVPRGQDEAARALALGTTARLWHVVLPQAMRIAVPPIGNQYLNLLKNSSLGLAISYFELTKVTSVSIGNAKPAVPSFLLLMAIYLVISLTVSAVVNLANRRLALVER